MENLVGRKFGALTVLQHLPHGKYEAPRVLCECECGNTKAVMVSNLKRGYTRSCGCGIYQPNAKFVIELDREAEIKAWVKSGAHSKKEVTEYLKSIIYDSLED